MSTTQTVKQYGEFAVAQGRTLAEQADARLIDAWPRGTKRERAMFERLKEAYVKARYSRHYRIEEDELAWLGERVEALGRAVEEVCRERLADLRGARGPDSSLT